MRSFAPFLDTQHKCMLLLTDFLGFLLIAWGVYSFRLNPDFFDFISQPGLTVVALSTIACLYVFGCYDLDHGLSQIQIFFRQVSAFAVPVLVTTVYVYIFSKSVSGVLGRGVLFGSLLVFFAFSFLYRMVLSRWFNRLRKSLSWLVIIDPLYEKTFTSDISRMRFEGHLEYLKPDGPLSELDRKLDQEWSSIVLASRSNQLDPLKMDKLVSAKLSGHEVTDLSGFYEKHWKKVPIYCLGSEWFISSTGFQRIHRPVFHRIKRLMDAAFALILGLLTLPLTILTALAIRISSPGPVIYRQTRTGKDGRLFTIYKFRSMTCDAEKNGAQWAQKNDSRITPLGRFLRSTRLDELPQLWNVLRGEMSFVGPRPERPEFNHSLERQIPYYNLRHSVRPGLTGWAQVLYPYGANVEDATEKLQYDLFYVKHYSPLMDLLICLKTISVILMGKGR